MLINHLNQSKYAGKLVMKPIPGICCDRGEVALGPFLALTRTIQRKRQTYRLCFKSLELHSQRPRLGGDWPPPKKGGGATFPECCSCKQESSLEQMSRYWSHVLVHGMYGSCLRRTLIITRHLHVVTLRPTSSGQSRKEGSF